MITEEIRSYEVSVWTLQDEFLTVLKWSDAEQKGRIENPKMILNIDGTQEFTFSIPMYYYKNGKLIDNPNWYNIENGNLIEGLRKIKVIFNKGNKELEEVFEFLVINMDDSHEKDIASCEVKCEGLAFHELGKQGYKITLSQENFEEKYKKWTESDKSEPEPTFTLDYWCGDKETCDLSVRPTEGIIDPNTWYYTVRMNQESFKNGTGALARSSAKIYEEPVPIHWNENLIPDQYIEYKEKERMVTADKSNLYNLTQTIAEAFQVHCKYEYTYDENYHITSRTIVFYNHFFQEEKGAMSFTYPYSSSKITRTSDCSNLTTKMYVLTTDNDKTVAGYNTIMNASSNPTSEDYILNFDYMLKRGVISQDQYDAIKPYEIAMRDYNKRLIIFQQNLAAYNIQKPEIEAKVAVYKKSIELDKENITQNQSLKNALDLKDGDADGNITIDSSHPDMRIIQQDNDGAYYIKLDNTNKGIQTDTVKIYRGYSSANHQLSGEVTSNFSFDYDEYKRPSKILNVAPENNSSTVYLTYKYNPQLYYDAVLKVWKSKWANDTLQYAEFLSKLGPKSTSDINFDYAGAYVYYAKKLSLAHEKYEEATQNEKDTVSSAIWANCLNKQIKDAEDKIEELTNGPDGKKAAIKEFNRLMGAALRESYWQPEDYQDYGLHKEDNKELAVLTEEELKANTEESFIAFWDTELFDEEDKNYYEESVNLNKIYYPCIDLSSIYNSIKNNIMSYSFIFNNNYTQAISNTIDTRYTQIFSIGSGALLEFGLKDGTVHPLLVLVGAKSMTNDEITFMKSNTVGNTQGGNPRIARISTNEDGMYQFSNGSYTLVLNTQPISVTPYFVDGSEYTTVYPRAKFSSLNLRAASSDLTVYYNNQLLEIAQDYNIYTRNTPRTIQYTENGTTTSMTQYFSEYFLTVKPEVIYKCGTFTGDFNIHYILSNADNEIYLDALEVMKENAEPKVEYTIEPNILDHNLSKILYKKLATLVMINDVPLKLDNVFGYISKVELDLDNVTKDQVEVKNYKGKFEDLFSTIVAQTEQMKQDGAKFHAAIEGNIPLDGEGLENTLSQNQLVMQAYLDSYFDSSQVVKDRLAELFTEAGEILGDSNKTLNKMRALTLDNADILSGFIQNISEELSPKVYRQAEKPDSFKPGDVWIDNEGNHYVATGFNENSQGNGLSGFVRTHDGTLASITGAGMNIDAEKGLIDIYAQNEIQLRSGKHVYIGANDSVDIVGNNKVNIGGGEINIAGEANVNEGHSGGINLVSTGIDIKNSIDNMKSYTEWESNHLYKVNEWVKYNNHYYRCKTQHTSNNNFVSNYWTNEDDTTIQHQLSVALADATISKVLIDPDKIELGSADILMRGANKIQMVTSRGTNASTSAIEISPETGIWIGSGQGVRLFSGGFSYNETTNVLTKTDATGASVELNSNHLILGFMEVKKNSGTIGNAIEMTQDYMILASGSPLSGTNSDASLAITGTSTGLVGAKFTSTSIGFATQRTGSGTAADPYRYNAIIMNDKGITLGSTNGVKNLATETSANLRSYFANTNYGSYVRISDLGIELGSLADLYINTDNFKLQTHSRDKGNTGYIDGNTLLALGKGLQEIGYTTSLADIRTKNTRQNNPIQARLVINDNGAYFEGDVYANNGYFHGNVHATNFILEGTAVTDFNTAITGSSAYTTLPSTREKLYYMSTSTSAPSKPPEKVTTASTDSANTWSLTMPQYPQGTTLYYYYTCIQTTTQAGVTTWTNPIRENQATEASTITEQFKANGLLSNYSWGGITWPVALTSTSNLLIGANGDTMNGGIWIAKSATYSDGAAVVINKDGIAMAGSTISLNADSTISITSGATININASNLTVKSDPGDGENYFYAGTSAQTIEENQRYIKFTKKGALTIKGVIQATELSIGGVDASDYVKATQNNPDLTPYAQYADFNVGQGRTYASIPASISASVWDTVGNGTHVQLTVDGLSIDSSGSLYVNTNNVVIDSNDINNDDTIFELKGIWAGTGATGTFLRMNKTQGGFFAGWNFNLGWIWAGTGTNCVAMCGMNSLTPPDGVNTGSNEYSSDRFTKVQGWAFYCGADWPEAPYTTSIYGYAPFRVSRGGSVYTVKLLLGKMPWSTDETDDWSGYGGELYLWHSWTKNDANNNPVTHYGYKSISSQKLYEKMDAAGWFS